MRQLRSFKKVEVVELLDILQKYVDRSMLMLYCIQFMQQFFDVKVKKLGFSIAIYFLSADESIFRELPSFPFNDFA